MNRLLNILLGYAAADLVASTILITAEQLILIQAGKFDQLDYSMFALIGGFLDGSLTIFSSFVLLPALIGLVAIAEAYRVRIARTYAVVGGLEMTGLAWYLGWFSAHPWRTLPVLVSAGIIAGSGIIAGLVYWKIAGHNAGAWREPSTTAAIS